MITERLQLVAETIQAPTQPAELERERRFQGALTEMSLRDENVLFERTRGVSQNNRAGGFAPAYRDQRTGEVAPSRFADGSPAPIHLLDGLPEHWVARRTETGRVASTLPGIVAGFVRDGHFYTREQAARLAAH